MSKEFTQLEIKSSIADYAGKWDKVDVEDEIKDCLGIVPEENGWIEYVIDHIDCTTDEEGKLLETVAENDAIEDIKIRLTNGGWIRITKKA